MVQNNPDLSDVEPTAMPKNTTVEATIEGWTVGTIGELWDNAEEVVENNEDMTLDNQRLQIHTVVSYEGNEFEFTEDIPYYEQPTDRTSMGRFLQQYTLEKGVTVEVHYDNDGKGQIVGIRG